MMHKFKTLWCPNGEPHNWETCVYAHTYRDWRRVPSLGYSSRPCPSWSQSLARGFDIAYSERCRFGMACPMAHGAKEQLYHPQFYKKSPCENPGCSKDVRLCAFTHGVNYIRKQRPPSTRERKTAIPEAIEFLTQHQPMFMEPPKYFSIEGSEHSKGPARSAKGSDSQTGQVSKFSEVALTDAPCSSWTPFVCEPEPQFPLEWLSLGYAPMVIMPVILPVLPSSDFQTVQLVEDTGSGDYQFTP